MPGLKTSQPRKEQEEKNLEHQVVDLKIIPTRVERENLMCDGDKEKNPT